MATTLDKPTVGNFAIAIANAIAIYGCISRCFSNMDARRSLVLLALAGFFANAETSTCTETTCTGQGGDWRTWDYLGGKDGPCIFPFIYNGISRNQCGDYGNYDEGDWCATEVKTDGEVKKYGLCTCGCYPTAITTATIVPSPRKIIKSAL